VTAEPAVQSQILPVPKEVPSAIRAVLAANADPEVLQQYEHDLDEAYKRAQQDGDTARLTATVHHWWKEAVLRRDPVAYRELIARAERYLRDGPPPLEERMTREQIRAKYGI
jgi:hypothetical protein